MCKDDTIKNLNPWPQLIYIESLGISILYHVQCTQWKNYTVVKVSKKIYLLNEINNICLTNISVMLMKFLQHNIRGEKI